MKAASQKSLKIEKLIYRGSGLGHWGGKAVFVPFTAPGDIISWETVQEKKRFIQGRLLDVLSPSPDRVAPLCPDFGRCGGCQWQHIHYRKQGHWKHKIVAEILAKTASIPAERVAPILPSPSPWHYRARARLAWGKEDVGFYRNRSHRIIPIEHCPLLDPRLNNILSNIQKALTARPLSRMGKELLLEVGDSGTPRVILRFRPGTSRRTDSAQDALQEVAALAERGGFSLWADTHCNGAPTLLAGAGKVILQPMADNALKLTVPPGGFSQVNLAQNRRLTALVAKIIEDSGASSCKKKVLDLYCGMGNFSLPIALKGGLVTGVDSTQSAIKMARQNAVASGIHSARFICANAGDFLRKHLRRKEPPYDILVMDPPRTGALEIAKLLTASNKRPEIIVYVSCDPMTHARDLKMLTPAAYDVQSVIPIDMFPQTFHIETFTVLRRR